jgi:hypothetical protein
VSIVTKAMLSYMKNICEHYTPFVMSFEHVCNPQWKLFKLIVSIGILGQKMNKSAWNSSIKWTNKTKQKFFIFHFIFRCKKSTICFLKMFSNMSSKFFSRISKEIRYCLFAFARVYTLLYRQRLMIICVMCAVRRKFFKSQQTIPTLKYIIFINPMSR